jgi:hypothetical protein
VVLRLWLELRRAERSLKREAKMGNYDWRITAWKGLRALGAGALSVLLPAIAAYLSDPIAVGTALASAGYSPSLVAAAVPIVLALGAMFRNWATH